MDAIPYTWTLDDQVADGELVELHGVALIGERDRSGHRNPTI